MGFHSSSGCDRRPPQRCEPYTRAAQTSTVPLMGFSSLQRSPARRSRLLERFHPPTPCVFRVRALLTPCSPSSLLVISDLAAPGIFTFRALFLPEIRRSFELTRALLSVARPRSPHASSVKSGPGLLSKLIRLREGPSKPSSGLYSLRESVPLHVRFRVVHRPMPSWFSSSPGLSPPWSAGWPSPSVRSRASHRSAPFRATTDPAPQRLARPGGGVVSHETASPPEVLPLYPPVSSRVPAALGY